MALKQYDYLIVGAGLYGATVAQQLKENNYEVKIIDKRNHIGGNCYTQRYKDLDIHEYGPHVFHTSNKRVWNYISQFSDWTPFKIEIKSKYKNNLYSLPFNMNTFKELWGITTKEEAKQRIQKTNHIKNRTPTNLEEQAVQTVGREIYNKLIKGYTEKQWKKQCNELPPDIIKRIPVRYTYDNNYFNDEIQAIPNNGYTELIHNMIKNIPTILETDYLREKNKFNQEASKIIYTGRIDELYNYKYGKLEYLSLKFNHKEYNTELINGRPITNYPEKTVPYTREIEHKFFKKKIKTEYTVLTRETPVKYTKTTEPYYPVPTKRNNKLYQKYKVLNDKDPQILVGGRLGLYKYLNMDETIRLALELSDKLIKHNPH